MDTTRNFLKVLAEPNEFNAVAIDIVAVHGLNPFKSTSNATSTWTSDNGKMWLQDEGFLPTQIPNARIMLFGYNSNVAFTSSNAGLAQQASNLLQLLDLRRGDCPERPIIFLCHSLGGILVKRALVHARLANSYTQVYEAAYGVVFFGTPHGGGNNAKVGILAANIAKFLARREDNSFMDALKKNSFYSEQNRDDFLQIANDFNFLTFYESTPTRKFKVIATQVVDRQNAILGLNDTKEPKFAMDADHSHICKFDDHKGQDYLPVWTSILNMSKQAIEKRVVTNFGHYQTHFSLQGIPAANKFVERPSDTVELERALLPQRQNCRRKISVLYGLGGMGKTQLAVDFARRHHRKFSSVFWLDGGSEDSLKKSLANCANKIPEEQISAKSRNYISSGEGSIDIVIAEMMDWLRRPDNTGWLLIFDNVDRDFQQHNPEPGAYDINCYLPCDHGSVLITTRLSKLAQLGDSRRLNKVDEHQAQAIFQKWYGSSLDSTNTDELWSLLDGLPLAIAQAAAYLRESGLDLSSYIRYYKGQWKDLMESHDRSGFPLLDYPERSVWTTWTISFNAIKAKNEAAANLLLLWAFLDNKDLWHGLFHEAVINGEHWPEWLEMMAVDELRFVEVIKLLQSYSMIDVLENTQSYATHPVVHKWASYMQNDDQRKEYMQLAVTIVGFSIPIDEKKEDWALQRRLLPHANSCLQWILTELKSVYGEEGYFNEESVDATMNMIKVFQATMEIGRLYYDQGKLKEAEEMFQRALTGFEKALGQDHTLTLHTVDNLGALYIAQGKLKEAEEMFQRALTGHKKTLGQDHTSTLDTVHNLGALYKSQGKLKEAEEIYQRVLTGHEKTLGQDHTSTLHTVHNLGVLYKAQGKLKEAEEMYQRALIGREKALGQYHISTLETVHNLGNLYIAQGKLKEAEEMFQRALTGFEKALGQDHTSTLNTVHSLGVLYWDQGKLKEAEDMFQRALVGYQTSLGPSHEKREDLVKAIHSLHQSKETTVGTSQILVNENPVRKTLKSRLSSGLSKVFKRAQSEV